MQVFFSRHIFEFLADEILNEQPLEMTRFLLETAVLDELTPELCSAVTQRQNAYQLLDNIFRRNLFLTLADNGNGEFVYRWSHYCSCQSAFPDNAT